MNLGKIYSVINEILDSYIIEGIKPEHLLTFLNADENNYKFIYNKIYRKLNMENIQFESSVLTECLQDSIRDKIGMLNDMASSTNESSYVEKPKEPNYVQLPKKNYTSLVNWKDAVWASGNRYKLQKSTDYRYWIAFNDDDIEVKGFFTIEEPYDAKKKDYIGHGYVIIKK